MLSSLSLPRPKTIFFAAIPLFFGAIVIAAEPRASACGASTGGVAGLSACSVDEHNEEVRPKWHVSTTYAYTSTGIRFDNVRPDETRFGYLVALEAIPFPDLTIQVGAGFLINGGLTLPGAKYDFDDSGVIMAIGGSYRFVAAKGARPFVLATLGLTFSSSQTKLEEGNAHALYDAFDARVGGVVGWNIANHFAPYAVARAFGGPIYWTYHGQSEIGTDVHHFQLGAGLGMPWGKPFDHQIDLFVEGVPLGEVGISAGIGIAL